MIVCRTCGHNNPDDAQFCESCKSFLEFTGERTGGATGATGAAGPTGGVVPTAAGGSTPGAGSGPAGGTAGAGGSTAGAGGAGVAGAAGLGGPTITDRGTGITVDASMPPCPRCGTPNESTRTFCKYCGERLTATAPVADVTTKSRFSVDPRLAIGGAVVVLALGATAAFALVLNGAKPGPTAAPSVLPSFSPPVSLRPPSASPSAEPSATDAEPSATDEPTETPSDEPTDSASPGDTEVPATEPPETEAPVTNPPTEEPSVPPPTAPTSIAFYAVRNGKVDVFTIPPGGGTLTNRTNDLAADSDPKWSPDGRRLAFDSRRVDNNRNIWVLELDGTFNQLTRDQGATNAFPTWSPDGQQIAFVHNGEIWVMNSVDGSNAHPLTTGADDSRPTWSQDGRIAYHRTTPGNHEIWSVPADSSAGAEPLIPIDNGGGRQPSWSPDGSRLAYAKIVDGVLRIVVANSSGGAQKTITTGAPCPCQFPTWSPDGKRIAFQGGASKKEQIYVISASGGSPKRVTDGQGQNLAPGWGS